MDIRKIRKLIELINETGVGEIEVKSGEESVRISRFTSQASMPSPLPLIAATPIPTSPIPAAEPPPLSEIETKGYILKSPMVGTVYLAKAPGEAPFVRIGQRVSPGDTLCLIEAMKMFNKIETDIKGVISTCLVENGQPVEYDQPLFLIEPN